MNNRLKSLHSDKGHLKIIHNVWSYSTLKECFPPKMRNNTGTCLLATTIYNFIGGSSHGNSARKINSNHSYCVRSKTVFTDNTALHI